MFFLETLTTEEGAYAARGWLWFSTRSQQSLHLIVCSLLMSL